MALKTAVLKETFLSVGISFAEVKVHFIPFWLAMFSKLVLPLGPHTWVAVRETVHGPYLLKMSAVAM